MDTPTSLQPATSLRPVYAEFTRRELEERLQRADDALCYIERSGIVPRPGWVTIALSDAACAQRGEK